MAERPGPPKQTFSQQVVWALTRRAGTAAPLSSAATASPSQHPVDHRNLRDTVTSLAGNSPAGPASNPFDHLARPPSPITLEEPLELQDEPFSTHALELLKPLPLTSARRTNAIKERTARLHIIARATADQKNPHPPPQSQVIRLVIALLATGTDDLEQDSLPNPIKEAALDLLNEAVKLSDAHASAAPKALIETRSGAPGSQSSKSMDSDQPLATIDRALLYRLVVEDFPPARSRRAGGPNTIRPSESMPSIHDLSATALPCLHAKLRALETLSKGGREVVAFENIVQLIGEWLVVVWEEVQALRQLAKMVNTTNEERTSSTAASVSTQGGPSSQPIDRHVYVEHLSAREWSLCAILHLLTSILMFSFAKVNQDQVKEALITVARLFVDPLPEDAVVSASAAGMNALKVDERMARRESLPDAFIRANPSSTSRSRSRDTRARQPSLEGYSYYGLEGAASESNTSTSNSPAVTPRLGPRGDRGSPSVAPISLATLPPSSSSQGTVPQSTAPSRRQSRLSSFVTNETDDDLPSFPELQDVEVRCVVKLLDVCLKFGHIPPPCVPAISEMLCRVIGFEPVLAVAASPNGMAAIANTMSIASLMPWQEAVLPVLANLLRSHSANTALEFVRGVLVRSDGVASVAATLSGSLPGRGTPANQGAGSTVIEDEATLVGAVLFLRFALSIVARETSVSSGSAGPPTGSTGSTHGTACAGASGNVSTGHGSAAPENALAPRLSLFLILPALRGALQRHSDLVDLQVVSLVEALLVPSRMSGDGAAGASIASPSGTLSPDDWNELLQLTLVADRHIETWRCAMTSGQAGSGSEVRVPVVLHALIALLSRVPLAPADHVGLMSTSASAASSATVGGVTAGSGANSTSPSAQSGAGGQAPSLLPWTPRLCALLLALGPALPTRLVHGLIEYHKANHLCMPCTPDWTSNLQKLLQAFSYGHYQPDNSDSVGTRSTGSWASRSHHALTTFLFDYVYESVVSFPEHRNVLLRKIILPTAHAVLGQRAEQTLSNSLRRILVQAAALSSATESSEVDGGEVGAVGGVTTSSPRIFDAVRDLFVRLAREGTDDSDLLRLTSPVPTGPGHVHFATAPGLHEHKANNTQDQDHRSHHKHHSSISDADGFVNVVSSPHNRSRGTPFALDLIAIFNAIAFASPWLDFEDGARQSRADQERLAREACLAIFRDLREILQPTGAGAVSSSTAAVAAATKSKAGAHNQGPRVEVAGPNVTLGPASTPTRLAVLQWFLHIRTDRHHRVYLAGDLDDLVGPSAATLLRTAESRAAAATAEAQVLSSDRTRAARNEGRESRRTQQPAVGSAAAAAAAETGRSRSRVRDASTERGRAANKAGDSPRRAGDRSVSATRRPGHGSQQPTRKGTATIAGSEISQPLWQIPEVLAFEMPPSSLRSDIVYTYIHDDDPTCSHAHVRTDGGVNPAPLPVSALLATYIDIIDVERDWELVSYLICYLPHQLANKHLFCGPKAQKEVLVLRQHLCSAIDQQKLMPEVILPEEEVKRSDVYAVVYATLTTLLSYRALFSRNQQEEMVDAFVAGLNKSQNTALPCVRALSVAVYEAQKSVTRLLPKILLKLSTIMSSMTMSVHILELIASIGQIPACYANFTEAEYRRVFGIALQYIQYHQSPAGSGREDFRSSPASFALSQYVMMLAYFNISLWFMTLRLSDRPKHVSSITRGLLLANEGKERLSDNSEVCFDFLARFAHSNADSKPTRSFLNSVVMRGPGSTTPAARAGLLVKETGRSAAAGPGAGAPAATTTKTWLVGRGLITVTALKKEGWVEVVIRRASGTTAMLCKVENAHVSTLPDDDDVERVDLPAVLMMDRDPEVVNKPVLRAPPIFDRASPFVLGRSADDSDQDDDDDGDGTNGGEVAAGKLYGKSLVRETKDMLRAGERLRRRRPKGPAHFGMGTRPRAASFSGAIDGSTPSAAAAMLSGSGAAEVSDPYHLQPDGNAGGGGDAGAGNGNGEDVEEGDETLVDKNNAGPNSSSERARREDTIAQVMREILAEGDRIHERHIQEQHLESDGNADKKITGSDDGAPQAARKAYRPPPKQSVERDVVIDPSTIALQLSSYPDFCNQPPILLPDEPATTRLIKAIDLTPVVDLHKIGCVYVGPGRKTEQEILGNRHGSPAYARFLAGLGDLITLKGQEDMYTGGLDRDNDFHGKYAYAWSDDISQIVFHAATMMPNRLESDPRHSHKKALIGNDWVHIVFNESGDEYNFGTIPSQFNYVNIVISPNTKGGTALGSVGPVDTSFYRVSLQRRDGLPSFSPVGDGQLISALNLPAFVRSLALNSNVMSQIYNDTGESMTPYSSNWCNRLNHVLRFKGMWEAKRRQQRDKELADAGFTIVAASGVGAVEGGGGGGGVTAGAAGIASSGEVGNGNSNGNGGVIEQDWRDFTNFS